MLGDILTGGLSGFASGGKVGALVGAGVGLLGGLGKKKRAKQRSKDISNIMNQMKESQGDRDKRQQASLDRGKKFAEQFDFTQGKIKDDASRQAIEKEKMNRILHGASSDFMERTKSQSMAEVGAKAEAQQKQLGANLSQAGIGGGDTAAAHKRKLMADLLGQQAKAGFEAEKFREQQKTSALNKEMSISDASKFDIRQASTQQALANSAITTQMQMDEASHTAQQNQMAQLMLEKSQADAAAGGGFLGLF